MGQQLRRSPILTRRPHVKLPEPRPYANNPTIQRWLKHLDLLATEEPPEQAWAKWPTKLATSTARAYVTRINNGQLLGAGYQATTRNTTLYVRKRT